MLDSNRECQWMQSDAFYLFCRFAPQPNHLISSSCLILLLKKLLRTIWRKNPPLRGKLPCMLPLWIIKWPQCSTSWELGRWWTQPWWMVQQPWCWRKKWAMIESQTFCRSGRRRQKLRRKLRRKPRRKQRRKRRRKLRRKRRRKLKRRLRWAKRGWKLQPRWRLRRLKASKKDLQRKDGFEQKLDVKQGTRCCRK